MSELKELQRQLRREKGKFVSKRVPKKKLSKEQLRRIKSIKSTIALRKSLRRFRKLNRKETRRRKRYETRFFLTGEKISGEIERREIRGYGQLVLPFDEQYCVFKSGVKLTKEFKTWKGELKLYKKLVKRGKSEEELTANRALLDNYSRKLQNLSIRCFEDEETYLEYEDSERWYH